MSIIVYKTTNLINDKFYIGVHDTNSNLSKYYLGSGIVLKKAIKKYGNENFIRETLMEFDTSEEAYDYEAWLVNDYMVNRPDCYNARVGGKGSSSGEQHPMYGKEVSTETRQKIREANWGKAVSTETRLKMSKAQRGRIVSEESRGRMREAQKGKIITEKCRQKISEANSGEKNGFFGKTHSMDIKHKLSEKAKKECSIKQKCIYCGTEGTKPNIYKYHFNNCPNSDGA